MEDPSPITVKEQPAKVARTGLLNPEIITTFPSPIDRPIVCRPSHHTFKFALFYVLEDMILADKENMAILFHNLRQPAAEFELRPFTIGQLERIKTVGDNVVLGRSINIIPAKARSRAEGAGGRFRFVGEVFEFPPVTEINFRHPVQLFIREVELRKVDLEPSRDNLGQLLGLDFPGKPLDWITKRCLLGRRLFDFLHLVVLLDGRRLVGLSPPPLGYPVTPKETPRYQQNEKNLPRHGKNPFIENGELLRSLPNRCPKLGVFKVRLLILIIHPS